MSHIIIYTCIYKYLGFECITGTLWPPNKVKEKKNTCNLINTKKVHSTGMIISWIQFKIIRLHETI